jgi:hypothetical protein
MRQLVSSVSMRGVVVIGEGEEDQAPMLYNGEEVGDGRVQRATSPSTPSTGTTLMAKGMPKSEGQFSIAKAILAFANREPTRAASICEGTAYMVVGAQPGSAPGVSPIDHADLGQGVRKYCDGPRWSPHYVRHDDATVLVVIVEAPRRGDPIHVLGKAYNNFAAGTIFHRGTAQSEPAGPKEIAMLSERLVQGAREPDLALDLSCAAAPLTRLLVSDGTTQEWLDKREAHVRANSREKPPKPKPLPPSPKQTPYGPAGIAGGIAAGYPSYVGMTGLGGFMNDLYANPGDREKFEEKVATHLAQCRDRLLDNAVRQIVLSDENIILLAVSNDTDDPITAVEVTARIPKCGAVVYVSAPSAKAMPGLPKWPTPMDDTFAKLGQSHLATMEAAAYDVVGLGRASVHSREDHFEISWTAGNLLARTTETLDVTVIPGTHAPDEIEVELTARAMSHRGVARSTSALAVSSDDWQLAEWWSPTPDD